MTGKDRMLTALDRREPDRVPVWEMAFNEESIIKIGRFFTDDLPPMKFASQMIMEEKIKLLNTLFTFAKALELDGLTSITLPVTEKIDEAHYKDGWGRVLYVAGEGEATAVGGPVSGPDDLKDLKIYHPQDMDFLMLMASTGSMGKDIAQVFVQPGPFRECWSLLGSMEKLLFYYIKKPSFVLDLGRIVTDYILEVVDKAAALGADVFALDGDLAFNQTTLMSPAQYRQFIFPFHQEIVARAHDRGLKIIKHSDGNMGPILEDIAAAGFDGFHPNQPQCMDIGEVKARFGNRLCLLGNIDCTYLLPFGTEEEVEQTVKETIAKAAPGGGYIISSSNSIHPGCKAENYLAMVRAAHKYGTYPIQEMRP